MPTVPPANLMLRNHLQDNSVVNEIERFEWGI